MALRQEEFTSLCDDVDLDRDRALVERCQAGDSAAFGNLYARYYERLLRFCLRRLNDRHEAEDAAQEAFARAWKALPKFAGERRFYPWLTVIAGNICTDVLRRRSRSTPTDDLELGSHQPVGGLGSETSEELILAAVDGQLVNRALDRLSVRHRHVLAMREGSGWSYQQMADHEGVEIGTIETLLWRARQALKREFNVLAESKGALAGFLAGAGALVRRGLQRVAHKIVAPPGVASGGLRNLFTGVAVTSATVAAALIAPHALSTAHADGQAPPAARAAAALASPPLPLTLANSALASSTAPAVSPKLAIGPAGPTAGPAPASVAPAATPPPLLPGGQVPSGSAAAPLVNSVTQATNSLTSGVTGGVASTVSGLASTLGLSQLLSQLGLAPSAAKASTAGATSTSTPLSSVTGQLNKTVTSTVKSLLGSH
ncbi:MAG TPA: RNA polymerase sigma factor [Acidimicrobiales bacterium]|nr:RNA polymerase sigma factor [Acidimicrobiales bacterium]